MSLARMPTVLSVLALVTGLSGPAAAQAPAAADRPAATAPAAAAPAAPAVPPNPPKRKPTPEALAARQAALAACSAEADAKGLHKQERKSFRADCVRKAMQDFRAKSKEARKAARAAKTGVDNGSGPKKADDAKSGEAKQKQ